MRLVIVFIVGAFLLGCQPTNRESQRQTQILELKRPISIPAHSAHTVFQFGRQKQNKDLYEWHCEFEVNDVKSTNQIIKPDYFQMIRSYSRIVGDEQTGMPNLSVNVFNCSERYYETLFWLRSDRQPNVRSILCRIGTNFCSGYHFISSSELEQTLGKSFMLH